MTCSNSEYGTHRCVRCDREVEELDAQELRSALPTREEMEYTRAMAVLKKMFHDPLGDDLSDHVARLNEQWKTTIELLRRLVGPTLGGMGFGAEDRQAAKEDALAFLRSLDEVKK